MGSDLYTVSVETYREHSTREAIARLAAHGLQPDAGRFFSGEGPWIEIELEIRSVHPDAPVGWDPVLVIRLLDEAVYHAARGDKSGLDFEKTPLFERYPEIWKMGLSIDREEDAVVRIATVEFRKNPHPREGLRDDPYGDVAVIAGFVHKKYAPNIADFGYWESRAWGGGGYAFRDYPTTRCPVLAEIRPIQPSLRLSTTGNNAYTALASRPEGGLWAATGDDVHIVTAEGGGRSEKVLDVRADHRIAGIEQLGVQPDGTLWMAAPNGVVRRDAAGKVSVLGRKEVFDAKKIECVGVSPEGHVFVGAANGLHCRAPDDTWTLVRDGLPQRAVARLTALPGGVVWLAGGGGLARRNADGTIDRFQSRQGIDSVYWTLALPDGGVVALGWSGPGAYIAPGAGRAVPDELLWQAVPGGVRHGTMGPDGTVWCIGRRGHLVRLRRGEAPRAYLWPEAETGLRDEVLEVAVSAEGDVWMRLESGKLAGLRPADFAEADAKPALNADMRSFARIAPVSFGPAAPAAAAAPAGIDFKGKTVVITGTLSKLKREEAHRVLAERGALLSETVNKKTDYLIAGIKPSSKLQKAKSLGIPVLDEDVLLAPAAPPEASAKGAEPAGKATGSQAENETVAPADLARRFPFSDQPAGDTAHLDAAMMRKMTQSKPPLTTKEWKALLRKHKVFLDAGGGNGKWQVLEVSGLLLAALEGYRPDKGEQASLYLKLLPPGFDARKAELSWLNGCGMCGEGVDFCGASLKKSVLSDSFLAGARFDAADLSGVDFSRADLRGASFRGAVLSGADFEACDLTGADFTGARVDEARFPGAKLGGVRL